MSIDNRDNRDTRPATDRHAQIESALDERTLAALAQAWSMAAERGLIAGKYFGGKDVQEIAKELAGYSLTRSQAREVLELASSELDHGLSDVNDALILEKIWQVVA